MNTIKVKNLIRLIVVTLITITIILPFAYISGVRESKPIYDMFGIGTKVNTWLTQHVELRKQTVRLAKYRIFHISPSDSLHIGKDGWIFYTLDHNLDIPEGAFPLEQSALDYQVASLSNLKKYYKLLGADFYYMSYPSKASIYPEYIRGKNYTNGETPSDIVINNLLSRTDVNALTPKWELIDAKSLGKTYLKMDVHASDLGAYVTYKKLCESISAKSGIDMKPIDVQFVDGEYPIGSNDIAGVKDLFGKSETGPVAVYESKVQMVTTGGLFEQVENVVKEERYGDSSTFPRVIFENPDAPNGTLLIYGTSMFTYDNIGENFQLTRYLAENFKRVFYFGNGFPVMPEIDSLIKPDIVIAECPERYSGAAGYRETPNIPMIASMPEIDVIPMTENANAVGNGGMWLDYFGDQLLESVDPIEVGDVNTVVMSGWAEDANTQLPLAALYIKLGDKVFKCNYGINRGGLSQALGFPAQADNAGFRIEIPGKFFDGVTQMEFVLIGTNGTYKYAPVVFDLK